MRFDGVLGGSVEPLDTKMLFDPLEEQFNLPATAIKFGDSQRSRIQAGIAEDPEILKAVELLNSKETVYSILNGSYKGETIFAFYTH